jgi:hypothetical protein
MLMNHACTTILNDICRGLRDLEVTEELHQRKPRRDLVRIEQEQTQSLKSLTTY